MLKLLVHRIIKTIQKLTWHVDHLGRSLFLLFLLLVHTINGLNQSYSIHFIFFILLASLNIHEVDELLHYEF